MLPTFLVIGPGRTGTSFLYQVFREHPDICLASGVKETNYFNNEYHRGEVWYRSFFQHCKASQARGELSNTYIYNSIVPERVQSLLPNVKIISTLRNPFQRIQSAFIFRKSVGEINPNMTFEEALRQHPDLITDNYYGSQLSRYFDLFPVSQLLVMFFEDFQKSQEHYLKTILLFIGVKPDFKSEILKRKINPSKILRYSFFAKGIRFVADTMRKMQMYHALDLAKKSRFLKKTLYKQAEKRDYLSEISKEYYQILQDKFIPEIKLVERLTGRDLSLWYQKPFE